MLVDSKHPIQFGRYELLERIAIGGMAELFKAQSRGAHGFAKTIAVKRILPQLAADEEFMAMFIDEAKVMVKMNHPNIVQVFDFGEVEGQYYIAMEYVDGIDGLALLRQCAQRRCRPTTAIVVHIMAAVLEALEYAHQLTDERGNSLRLVHRDISPANILIARTGEVKLGDFGIARGAFRQRNTETGVLKGKYGYMAPEQVSSGKIDRRTDIFTAGVVLAEMLMIRRLFSAKSDLDILLQIRDANLSRLDEYGQRIPPPLADALRRALARDPEQRFQTAGHFRDALIDHAKHDNRLLRNTDIARFVHSLSTSSEPLKPISSGEAKSMSARESRGVVAYDDDSQPTTVSPTRGAQPKVAPEDDTDRVSFGDHDSILANVVSQEEDFNLQRDEQARRQGTERGRIADKSLLGLFVQLATNERTGLLRVESSAKNSRFVGEVFFVLGQPESVTTNQDQQQFGPYLVTKEVITEGELAMARATLAHRGRSLPEMLVSLNLLSPLEVTRHMSHHLRWLLGQIILQEQGDYKFSDDDRKSSSAALLGLDTIEVLGSVINQLSADQIVQRRPDFLDAKVLSVSPPPFAPERFRLGPEVRRVYDRLNGQKRLAELLDRFDDGRERLNFLRIAYLLRETGFAR